MENDLVPSADDGASEVTVLVVDDDAALRKSFCRLLQGEGFLTTDAESGRAAIELLSKRSVDVVLSDVRMPDMDGIELLEKVRNQDESVSVVLISGAPDLETALRAVQLGATEYLKKPIHRAPLVASIERAAEITRNKRKLRADLENLRTGRHGRHSSQPLSGSWTGTLLGGRYEVGKQIGAGAMSVVYEAMRVDAKDQMVAVKIVHPNLRFNEDILERFKREAEIVARLSHQNIVRVVDCEAPADGPAFIIMERLHGVPLSELIFSESPLPVGRVVFIATQTLFALEAAHGEGVIHRDLKPENLFLTRVDGVPDVVRVLDFGIAKLIDQEESQRLTRTGAVMGTPLYLAPEQARGLGVDRRSDLYALGSIMYEALTGRVVFEAHNYNALLVRIQQDEPEALSALRPDLDPQLCSAVHRALAKDPEERFQNAREMIDALLPWLPSIKPGGMGSFDSLMPQASGKFRVGDNYRTTQRMPIKRGKP